VREIHAHQIDSGRIIFSRTSASLEAGPAVQLICFCVACDLILLLKYSVHEKTRKAPKKLFLCALCSCLSWNYAFVTGRTLFEDFKLQQFFAFEKFQNDRRSEMYTLCHKCRTSNRRDGVAATRQCKALCFWQ